MVTAKAERKQGWPGAGPNPALAKRSQGVVRVLGKVKEY